MAVDRLLPEYGAHKKAAQLERLSFGLFAMDYSTTSTMRRVWGSTSTGRSFTTV
jgi:hypothetical protein